MQSIVSRNKFAIVLVSLIVVVTTVDSQFIRVFYPTQLGNPGVLHLSLFIVLVVVASIISVYLLRFTKRNDSEARRARPLLFKTAFISTLCAQIAISFILFVMISEMLVFQDYNRPSCYQ
ncbi:hypothetical protein DYY65_06375 [Nitrososphaera sp. AFS]|nr:hypothetical protein [Nitrososphaera sp. AFS]